MLAILCFVSAMNSRDQAKLPSAYMYIPIGNMLLHSYHGKLVCNEYTGFGELALLSYRHDDKYSAISHCLCWCLELEQQVVTA